MFCVYFLFFNFALLLLRNKNLLHTHARARTHAHAHTHARTHTHTHTQTHYSFYYFFISHHSFFNSFYVISNTRCFLIIYRIFVGNLEKSIKFCRFYRSYNWWFIIKILFFDRDHKNEKLRILMFMWYLLCTTISSRMLSRTKRWNISLFTLSQTLSVHIFIFTGRDLEKRFMHIAYLHTLSCTIIFWQQPLLLSIVISIVRIVLFLWNSLK